MFEKGSHESWLMSYPASDGNFKVHLKAATPSELVRVYNALPKEGNRTKKRIILKAIDKKVNPQKMQMLADFKIYEREFERPNAFRQLTSEDLRNLSIGGFTFVVNGNAIPFDWDAHCCGEKNGVFHLETGYGPFFNDFQIHEYWDEEYAEMGLTRDQITAKFLASTTEIKEFYIGMFDEETDDDTGFGDNTDFDERFYIELLAISFEERETGDSYDVDESVIKAFNGNASDYKGFLKDAYQLFRKNWYASQSDFDTNSECLGYTIRQFENCEFVDDDYMTEHHPGWLTKRLLVKLEEV